MRFLTVFYVLLVSLSAFAVDMTPEEQTIRTAYAKLSYAVDLETAIGAVKANPKVTYAQLAQDVAKGSLTFRLTNFSCADISSVANQKYASTFDDIRDGGDVIAITSVTEKVTEGQDRETLMPGARPEWSHGLKGPVPTSTVAQMLPVMEQESGITPLLRYCGYTVTVSFEGRSRTYPADFYFGLDGKVAPGDMVVALGGGTLAELLVKPVYPQALVETAMFGKNSAIREFLETNQRSNATCRHGEACCDLSVLQCGVYSPDLKAGRQ